MIRDRFRRLVPFFLASRDYLSWKHEQYRGFTAVVISLSGFISSGLWVADWACDPQGARDTVAWRLLYLPSFFLVGWLLRRLPGRISGPMVLVGGLYVQSIFIAILNHLHHGVAFQMGGFMYFMLGSILFFQAFPLELGIGCTLTFTAFPQLAGLLGGIAGFDGMQYAVLMWPAAGLVLIAQVAIERNSWRRYLSEKALEQASNTDALTEVGNRRHFMHCLQRGLARSKRSGQPLSLLMLDIDNFKQINDRHGHSTGDRVIRSVAAIGCRTVREVDVVGRMGGEEFAVLLSDTTLAGAMLAAERIRLAVAESRLTAGSETVRCSVSVGCAEASDGMVTEEELLATADAALYAAKAAGRNRVMPVVQTGTVLDA